MKIGSHNSWTYLTPRKWWMKLIAFTARCQNLSIKEQYALGTRCFDLRIRFDKYGTFRIAHGIVEYDYSFNELYKDLEWLNSQSEKVYIRTIHEVRTEKMYTEKSIHFFKLYASYLSNNFTNLKFWCGTNLYNKDIDYYFGENPTCEEKYASVCSPKLIDDWWPWLFARKNNKQIKQKSTDKEILLIDFVNYG